MPPISCFKWSFTQKPPNTITVPIIVDMSQSKGLRGEAADRFVFMVTGTPDAFS